MQVAGKKLAVTGAGNGMGREVALELIRRGAKVIGLDINSDFLAETSRLADKLGPGFTGKVLDIADQKACEDFAAAHSDLDGLVNVAGIIQPFVRVEQLDPADIERVMRVNFFGPLNLIHSLLPTLKARPEAHILNVSSMGSYAPVPGQTIYGASKAALNLLTEGLRSELSETSVRLTLVWPGAIATNIAGNSGISGLQDSAQEAPKIKMVSAADAGRQMVNAIESNKKRIYIGQDATFMGRLSRVSPDTAAKLIYKNLKHLLG
jgi:short-subunit dehydrogenase